MSTKVTQEQLDSLQISLKEVLDEEQSEDLNEDSKKLDSSDEDEIKQLVDKLQKKGMSAKEIGKHIKDFLDQKRG